jgi:tetratricopeptide (TPR) repeat protein
MSSGRMILFATLSVTALCLTLARGAGAQTSGGQEAAPAKPSSGQQPDAQAAAGSGATGTTASDAPKVDPKEDAAYKSFYDLKPADTAGLIQQGEQFLQTYPQSRYRGLVYSRLAQAYFTKRDLDKMFATGQKALDVNPNDYTVMTLLGWVIPHTSTGSDPQAEAQLAKAENYSRRAVALLQTIPKPANLTEEQFQGAKNQALAQAHSGLGLTYFRQGKYGDSVSELQQSAKLGGEADATDSFVMGVDLNELKRYSEAASAFDECGKLAGGLQARCQENAAAAKKQATTQPAAPGKP